MCVYQKKIAEQSQPANLYLHVPVRPLLKDVCVF